MAGCHDVVLAIFGSGAVAVCSLAENAKCLRPVLLDFARGDRLMKVDRIP
jgi:hypothetical protein